MQPCKIPNYVTAEYLSALRLRAGLGSGVDGDRCPLQEVRSWLGLTTDTDERPPNVCPVIRRIVIDLTDARPVWLREVTLRLHHVPNTYAGPKVMRERAFSIAHWSVTTVVPLTLAAVIAGAPGWSECAEGVPGSFVAVFAEQVGEIIELDPVTDGRSALKAFGELRHLVAHARAASAAIDPRPYLSRAYAAVFESTVNHACFALEHAAEKSEAACAAAAIRAVMIGETLLGHAIATVCVTALLDELLGPSCLASPQTNDRQASEAPAGQLVTTV